MNLLECLVGLAISLILIAPLIKTTGELYAKQTQYEKTQSMTAEAERALELMGRAIRMAGFKNLALRSVDSRKITSSMQAIDLQKGGGFQGSDSIVVKHELSSGVDLDCIGNILTKGRTKNHLAHLGFLVDRQVTELNGASVNGGSLICQSLDSHGRIRNITLMNGVNLLSIQEVRDLKGYSQQSIGASRLFTIRLEMTDGNSIQREFTSTFATRNLL